MKAVIVIGVVALMGGCIMMEKSSMERKGAYTRSRAEEIHREVAAEERVMDYLTRQGPEPLPSDLDYVEGMDGRVKAERERRLRQMLELNNGEEQSDDY